VCLERAKTTCGTKQIGRKIKNEMRTVLAYMSTSRNTDPVT
jgi:hypothetical protein